jgi:hypothetical protein
MAAEKLRLGHQSVLAYHDMPVASFSPERLIANKFGVGPGEPDVLEHPVVEAGEFGAIVRPPPPFAQCREDPAYYVARRSSPPLTRDRSEPATRYLEMDRRHLSSPNVVERCECVHQNHLFISWRQCVNRQTRLSQPRLRNSHLV